MTTTAKFARTWKADEMASVERQITRRAEITAMVKHVANYRVNAAIAGLEMLWGCTRAGQRETMYSDGQRLVYVRGDDAWRLIDADLASEAISLKTK